MIIRLGVFIILTSVPFMAKSAVLITATETGGNVNFNYSGSIDTSKLTFLLNSTASASNIKPSDSLFQSFLVQDDFYTGITPPANFGTGSGFIAGTTSGDSFGAFAFFGTTPSVIVPDGYTSNDNIAGSISFSSATFNSLGVSPGTYNWTYTSDSTTAVTLTVVPEPHEYAIIASLGLLGLAIYRRRQIQRA